jgi:PHP family Zn ribbon phosphoesterase
LHLIPLAEIIALALGYKSPTTVGVQRLYAAMTEDKTEIEVLLNEHLGELEAAKVEPKVIRAIEAFRNGGVEVLPGGGGKYGEIRLLASKKAGGEREPQRSLFDF